MVRMLGFRDFIVAEKIQHPATPTMLAGLPEKWRSGRSALERAIHRGYLDAVEKAGGARGGALW